MLLRSADEGRTDRITADATIIAGIDLIYGIRHFKLDHQHTRYAEFDAAKGPDIPVGTLVEVNDPAPRQFAYEPITSNIGPILL